MLLSRFARADEVIESAFRNASFDGGEMTLRANRRLMHCTRMQLNKAFVGRIERGFGFFG